MSDDLKEDALAATTWTYKSVDGGGFQREAHPLQDRTVAEASIEVIYT
jgi:hypothetical protein